MSNKTHFFTVGPSQLYPSVPKHIKSGLDQNIYSLSHRSDTFKLLYRNTVDNLRALLSIPPTHHIFFTGSALEGMERTIQNTVFKHSFHFVNGSFSREFYQIATDLRKNPLRFDAANGLGFDFENVLIPKKSELITVVQNETSTGVCIPMESIYKLKKMYPEKLLAIDVVSSVPYVQIDFKYIDIAIFSVQKGFGLPAGLGVIAVNQKALEKAKWLDSKKINIGSYHSFLKLLEFGTEYQTRETPNVFAITLLGKVAGDMLEYGKERIIRETEEKAVAIYGFFDKHSEYKPYTQKPYRSKTTIVIDAKGTADKIIKHLAEKDFIVSAGYGKRKDLHIRIANFPAHQIQDVKKLLEAI